jgi:hypothetical protein
MTVKLVSDPNLIFVWLGAFSAILIGVIAYKKEVLTRRDKWIIWSILMLAVTITILSYIQVAEARPLDMGLSEWRETRLESLVSSAGYPVVPTYTESENEAQKEDVPEVPQETIEKINSWVEDNYVFYYKNYPVSDGLTCTIFTHVPEGSSGYVTTPECLSWALSVMNPGSGTPVCKSLQVGNKNIVGFTWNEVTWGAPCQ